MPLTVHDKRAAEVFADPESYATSLVVLLIDRFGTEALDWDAQTVALELAEEFGVTLPAENVDKLEALRSTMTTDAFFRDPLAFAHVVDALNGETVDGEHVPDTTPEKAAWAVSEVLLVEGAEAPRFDVQVRRYLGVCLEKHGMLRPPEPLKSIASYAPGVKENAVANLGDDPELYSAHFAKDQSDADDVRSYVRDRLTGLLVQLDRLPLRNRDAKSWEAFRSRYRDASSAR